MSEEDKSEISQVAHWVINGLFAFAFAIAGFVGKVTFEKIEKIDARMDEMPHLYITKEDFRHEQNELLQAINSIKETVEKNREVMQADQDRRADKLEKMIIELKSQVGPAR